jgi:hypothetical protein
MTRWAHAARVPSDAHPRKLGGQVVRDLLTILACVAVAACGPAGDSGASASPVAASSALPITSPSVTPLATPTSSSTPRPFAAADWGRIADPTFADRYGTTSMSAVAISGDTVVAVGSGPRGAAAWRSGPDGTWRRAPDDPSIQGGTMTDIVATPSGWVAVGQHGTEAAAWTSSDGLSWTPATVEAAGADPDSEFGSLMQHVAAGPDGLVAIGPGRDIESRPAEWASADGRTWTIVSDPIPGIGAANDIALMPAGWFVIVGAPADDVGSEEAWSSADGRTWTPLPGMTGMWVHAVAPWRGGIVAVGSVSDEDAGVEAPAVWVMAPDGGWERAANVPGSTTARDVSISAVAATADRIIATGPSPTGGVGIWISEDGTTWRLVDSPGLEGPEGEFEPRDIAADASRLVVVGEFPNGEASSTWSASVWTDPAPSQPAGPVPATVAHPCPVGAVALVDVAEMTSEERLACFGQRDLTLRGYLGQYDDPGMTAFPATPAWLADDTSCCRPFMPLPGMIQDIVWLPVAFPPEGPRQGTIKVEAAIEVTGHFDDPRSATCREHGVPKARSIASCRDTFVITSVTPIDRP